MFETVKEIFENFPKSHIKEKVLSSCSIVTLYVCNVHFSNRSILEDFPGWSVFKGSKVGLRKIVAVYSTGKQENVSYAE